MFLWFRALVKCYVNHRISHLKGFTKSTHDLVQCLFLTGSYITKLLEGVLPLLLANYWQLSLCQWVSLLVARKGRACGGGPRPLTESRLSPATRATIANGLDVSWDHSPNSIRLPEGLGPSSTPQGNFTLLTGGQRESERAVCCASPSLALLLDYDFQFSRRRTRLLCAVLWNVPWSLWEW